MGLLVAGKWQDAWYPTEENQGEFVRSESQFRHWITADGRAGPTGNAGFKAEATAITFMFRMLALGRTVP